MSTRCWTCGSDAHVHGDCPEMRHPGPRGGLYDNAASGGQMACAVVALIGGLIFIGGLSNDQEDVRGWMLAALLMMLGGAAGVKALDDQ